MASPEFTIKELESEEWRPIPGFDGYRISNLGRIESCLSTHPGFKRAPRILNPCPGTNGYPLVNLRRDRKTFPTILHRLVLETFVGPCPERMEGCHENGIRHDCRLTNLRWDTTKANHEDSVRHGTHNQKGLELGRKPRPCKYTPEQVRGVRANRDKYSKKELAAMFGMHLSSVKHVLSGACWSWLKD